MLDDTKENILNNLVQVSDTELQKDIVILVNHEF